MIKIRKRFLANFICVILLLNVLNVNADTLSPHVISASTIEPDLLVEDDGENSDLFQKILPVTLTKPGGLTTGACSLSGGAIELSGTAVYLTQTSCSVSEQASSKAFCLSGGAYEVTGKALYLSDDGIYLAQDVSGAAATGKIEISRSAAEISTPSAGYVEPVLCVSEEAIYIGNSCMAVSGAAMYLSDDVLSVSGTAMHLSDTALSVSGNTVHLSDGTLSVSGNALCVSGDSLILEHVSGVSGTVVKLAGNAGNEIEDDYSKDNSLYQAVLPTVNTVAEDETGEKEELYQEVLPVKKISGGRKAELSYPGQLPFQINSLNSLGNQQIVSDEYEIVNIGETDVQVVIENFRLEISDPDICVRNIPIRKENQMSESKEIYMILQNVSDWCGSGDFLTADSGETLSFTLSADESAENHRAVLQLGGSVTTCPVNGWKDNEVKMYFSIRYVPLEKEQEMPSENIEMTATDTIK